MLKFPYKNQYQNKTLQNTNCLTSLFWNCFWITLSLMSKFTILLFISFTLFVVYWRVDECELWRTPLWLSVLYNGVMWVFLVKLAEAAGIVTTAVSVIDKPFEVSVQLTLGCRFISVFERFIGAFYWT